MEDDFQEETLLADKLSQMRDELALKVHLGGAELKTQMEELEHKWTLMQSRLTGVRLARDATAKEVRGALQHLLHELQEGYARIRDALRKV